MSVSQTRFHQALRDARNAVPDGLSGLNGQAAGRRFDVYRNNVALSLIDALRVGFPAIAKLLGADPFTKLAHAYVQAHAPATPIMPQYGIEFPSFLQDFAPLQHLEYLPDLAKMELAMRQSYHAADAAPVDPERLTEITPEALEHARLHLAPPVILLQSDWPIYDLWRAQMVQDTPAAPNNGGQSVLITRAEWDPEPHLLSIAQGQFITQLRNGSTLSDALAQAPDCDLPALLHLLLSQNAITDISL